MKDIDKAVAKIQAERELRKKQLMGDRIANKILERRYVIKLLKEEQNAKKKKSSSEKLK